MAGNIRGITIEFRGDTTKLDKALRQINNETRNIDKELRNVDKALKFNPTSVELWRQKQQLLTQKIDETKQKLTMLKQAQAQMDADGVDKNSEEYRRLQREIIETESKVKTFEGQLRKIGNVNLRATSEQFKVMGDKLTTAGNAMRGVSMAAGALAVSIGALAYKSGVIADDLNTLSKVTGIGTDKLQMYGAAADLVDVSVEAIAKSNTRLKKSMLSASDGSGTQAEAFDALGVSVTNADGSLRDSDAVFQDVLAALGSMENETERDALAMQLMGKSASELNPLIEDGGETYKQVADTLAKYDLELVDQEALDGANRFNDALDTMKAIGAVALQTVGTQLAAYLAPALEKVVGWIGKFASWLSNLSPEVLTVIGVVAGVVAGIAPLLLILGKLAFAVSALAGPVGIVIAVIAALIAVGVLLYKNWDTIKAKAAAFKAYVVNTFNSLKASVAATFNNIKNAIVSPFETAVNTVKKLVNKIKGWFPINIGNIFKNVKLPHFNISWKSVGNTKLKIPEFGGIDWYKTGGIFDNPSVIGVGEAGPEAVIPLDKLWMKLDRIADASGGGIVVNVYGSDNMSVNELAEAVQQKIIQMQKRRTMAWQ